MTFKPSRYQIPFKIQCETKYTIVVDQQLDSKKILGDDRVLPDLITFLPFATTLNMLFEITKECHHKVRVEFMYLELYLEEINSLRLV